MNDSAGSFLSSIPFADKLGPIIIALAILIIGMIIARLVRKFLQKSLSNVSMLNRVNSDGSVTDLATPIATLVYGIIMLFVLIAVLGQMGLTDVLEPLKGMANKFLGYIPNIIGAGIVGYVGWILAKLISEFVGMGLGKADEQLALRTGNDDIKVSKLGSSFVFAAILLYMVCCEIRCQHSWRHSGRHEHRCCSGKTWHTKSVQPHFHTNKTHWQRHYVFRHANWPHRSS